KPRGVRRAGTTPAAVGHRNPRETIGDSVLLSLSRSSDQVGDVDHAGRRRDEDAFVEERLREPTTDADNEELRRAPGRATRRRSFGRAAPPAPPETSPWPCGP